MSVTVAIDISEVHRFSLEEYHQLIDSGGFDDDGRVELIDGLIVEMSPKGPAHENALAWLIEQLMDAVDRTRYQVRATAALTLEESGSEPEPDLMVIEREGHRPYHPTTASLVVEVSISSLRHDLRKGGLYARAGVLEYWVVDLVARRVIVHRSPSEDAYEQVGEVGAGGTLTSEVLGPLELRVDDLLAEAGF